MKMHKNTFAMAGLTAAAVIGAMVAVSPTAAADDHDQPGRARAAPPTPQQVPTGPGSVAGMATGTGAVAASNNPLLTTLTAALSGKLNPNVNLVDTLNGGEFTVFAPTDEAFAKIDPATIETAQDRLAPC